MTLTILDLAGDTFRVRRVPPDVLVEVLAALGPGVRVEVAPDVALVPQVDRRKEPRGVEGKPGGWFGLGVAIAKRTWEA